MQQVSNLIQATRQILNKAESEAKLTGHQFNIFKALNVPRDEKSLTRYLWLFLEPNGVHGRGIEPLQSFINLLPRESLDNVGISLLETPIEGTIEVKCEEGLGIKRRSSDLHLGGNVDLVIRWKNIVIVVENKPYAWDQPDQLERYYNSYSAAGFEPIIVYLTRNGSRPSENSQGRCPLNRVICLSYQRLVDGIYAYTDSLPLGNVYSASLHQFAAFLSYNFGLSTKNHLAMQDQITALLKTPDNFKAAIAISEAVNHFRDSQYKLLCRNILDELSSAGCELEEPGVFIHSNLFEAQKDTMFLFKDWDSLCLSIGFDKEDLSSVYFSLRSRGVKHNWSEEKRFSYMSRLNSEAPQSLQTWDNPREVWFYWAYYNNIYSDFPDPWNEEAFCKIDEPSFAKKMAQPLIEMYFAYNRAIKSLESEFAE